MKFCLPQFLFLAWYVELSTKPTKNTKEQGKTYSEEAKQLLETDCWNYDREFKIIIFKMLRTLGEKVTILRTYR